MCGITAYIGIKNAYKNILEGLIQLQNRGYDSAGISTLSNDGNFFFRKYASNEISALEKLKKHNSDNLIGIGHTRWATHGPKTDVNSHPHFDNEKKICLVHNGIIENYLKIKYKLINEGYNFISQTDTEIIVNLISYNLKKIKNFEKAIIESIKELEGTYALCILYNSEPNKLYCIRHGSPILVSYDDNSAIIASEQSGLIGSSNSYICLNNNDLCILEKNNDKLEIQTKNNYQKKAIIKENVKLTPYPYNHWMLKEIFEQKESIKRAISNGGRLLNNNQVKLGGLHMKKDKLIEVDNLILLGCGTSYFAGLTSINYFKDLCNFNTVQIFDGADFNENDIPRNGKSALILLSQSGETKDLHRCIEIGRKNDLIIIGVVNVVDSLIARESDCGCYLNAGREVAVASTKSFTSQVILLSMIAIWFSQINNINENKRIRYIQDLRRLELDIKNTLNNAENYKQYLKFIENKKSIFILGKGNIRAIAREGSLKIKEVSYIHAEGYSGSSLKHGPFGLLEKGFPVILLDTNDNHYNKMSNVYEEIKSRYAEIITISNNNSLDRENTIIIPYNKTYSNILTIIPLQILSYELSLLKGINPDFPRNLAKVVTVE